MLEPARATTELGLRLPVAPVDIATSTASLGSVPGVDGDNLTPEGLGLVFEEALELCEAPGVESAFCFSTGGFAPRSDVREILDHDGRSGFDTAKDGGRDNVIAIPSESLFATSEASKMLLCGLRAFGLKITSEAKDSFGNLFHVPIAMKSVIRGNGGACNTKVYAESRSVRRKLNIGQLDDDVQVELSPA